MSDRKYTGRQQPASYQIQVLGELAPRWLHWFDGLTIVTEPGDGGTTITTLTGPVPDQAGLRGILNRLWDLNLTLVSVSRCHAAAELQNHGDSDTCQRDESTGDNRRRVHK